MIDPKTIEQIKATSKIEEVVSDFVDLRRAGANLVGICPFHDEKTPSFSVSPAKGFFHCFGCGEHGDSISFLMKFKHFSYPDALRFLAEKYHITIVERELSEEDARQRAHREALRNICLFVNSVAQPSFANNQLEVADFLYNINIDYSALRAFNAGFCPEGANLTQRLTDAGNSLNNIVEVGLARYTNPENPDEGTVNLYDNCILLPVTTSSAVPLAFIAINRNGDLSFPPKSTIFNDNFHFFGIAQAAAEIQKQKSCLLTANALDVVALHAMGMRNSVAYLGAQFTAEQANELKRFAPNIIVLDNDAKRALTTTTTLLNNGLTARVFNHAGTTIHQLHTQVNAADFISDFNDRTESFVNFLLNYFKNSRLTRDETIEQMAQIVAQVKESTRRELYARNLSAKIGVNETALRNKINIIAANVNRKS